MADAPLDTGTTSPARRRPLLITVAAFIAIVVVVVGVTYAVYRQQLRTSRSKSADQLISIGGLKADQISEWLQDRRRDANTLRANEPIERLITQWLASRGGPLPADVRRYFAALTVNYQYASIAVFDRYGRQRWPAATGDDGQYVVEAVDGALVWGTTVFVDLHKSANGLPALGYVVPIDVAHGGPSAPVGAVYLRIDPARFLYPLVQTWPVPSGTAETLLVRRDGDMVIFLDPVRGFSDAPLTLAIPMTHRQLPATKAVNGVTGIVEGLDYRGAKVLADLRAVSGTRSPFGDTQWYMIAKVDSSEVYAGTFRRAATAIGVMAAVIAVAGFGMLLFWRSRESRSLQALYAAERERRALAQRYEYVTRNANDIMLLFKLDGEEMCVVDANERAVESYGYSLKELCALTLRDLRSEASPIGYEESLELVRGHGGAMFESEHRRRDGSVFPVEHSARLMEIDGREYIQTITRDITERRLAEQELRREHDFIAAVMDTAGALICVLDPQGRIVAFNRACEESTGYSFDELSGELIWERLVPPAEAEGVKAVFADLTAGALPSHYVNNWIAKDGSYHLIEWSNTIVVASDGDIEHVIGTGIDVTERRRVEVQFGAFFTHSPTGMAILDDQLRYIHVNEELAKMNGMAPKDHLGRSVAEVLPELAPTVEPMFRNILDTGVEMRGVEISGETPEAPGVIRHWLASYFPIRGPHGRAEHLGMSVVEITERRAAEERLSRLSRLYLVLTAVNEAIVRVREPRTLYAEMCRVLVEMGGFTMAWVGLLDGSRRVVPVAMAGDTGDYLDDIEITVDRRRTARGPTGRAIITGTVQICSDITVDPAMKPWREAALRHGFQSSVALPFRCDEVVIGAMTIYSDRVGALEDEDMRLLTQLAHDVSFAIESDRVETERCAAEEALRESERMLAEAQRLGHVGSWRFDVPSGALVWSSEQYRIFGLEADSFVPTLASFAEHVHPDDRSVVARMDEACAQGRQDEGYEMRIVRPDGEVRHISEHVGNIYGDDGAPLEMVGTTIDVTEHKVMEEEVRALNAELEQRVRLRTAQLEAANEELEAFAYSVSHDLRAPLRALDGFSLALLEDYAEGLDETAQDYLGRMRAASQRMGTLIDDLLGLSRVTRREMVLEDVDLSAVARRIVERFQQEQPERSVEFAIADGLRAQADPGLLEVLLENLLGNAWKFTSKRKSAHVEFAGDGDGGEVVYHVRDDGAGFDPTYAGKLFAPFQRLHTTSEFPGTGIGLATVQRIVHRHGGRCWAEGAPGVGATVYFTLAPANGQEGSDSQ